ncbi:hypothetical protein PQR34_46180 [Paraburkholderia sediminicola]|uniref:two-partner secretion domain-containing protein n=1 Tax=Paraburkholderia sediminicola TaxID=458836 RepID=UPI0038BA4585
MMGVMYFAPVVSLADKEAHAAPAIDPRAPIPFQPMITRSGEGGAVINVSTPNSDGLSVNQFQSLPAGPEGLIFNDSLTAATSLIGGQVGAKLNLAGRTAGTILARVISTGAQHATVLNGPIKIFGNAAALVIANLDSMSVQGAALTNMRSLVLTTCVPQFL